MYYFLYVKNGFTKNFYHSKEIQTFYIFFWPREAREISEGLLKCFRCFIKLYNRHQNNDIKTYTFKGKY